MESLANAIIFGLGQVALASPLAVEELAQIALVFDEFAVAIDVGVELAELQGQSGLGVFEDPGLGGFVFSGCGHDAAFYSLSAVHVFNGKKQDA
jgi:hypothetical protein